jgi:hypothetical protein
MDPLAALVLCTSALFAGLALLALLGRADRSRLIAAWVAMVGFAGFASFCFWKGIQLQQSVIPVYYEFPASPPGPQKLTLHKPGLSPGYRVRPVTREDRRFDKDLHGKLNAPFGGINICEKMALSRHRFDPQGVLEFESEYSTVVFQYEATAENRPLLEQAALEVTCPTGFHKYMAQGLTTLKLRTASFLGGLLLAGLGASAQRRKLRRLKPPPALTSPS